MKYYIRYADDFVIISRNQEYLKALVLESKEYLRENLDLRLHWKKVKIKRWNKGVDFLGYVSFPHHAVLRTKTKERMLRRIKSETGNYWRGETNKKSFNQTLQSYLGTLTHCRGHGLKRKIVEIKNGTQS